MKPAEPTAEAKGLFAKASKSLGFSKGYNFILWLVFGGFMMLFTYAFRGHIDYDSAYCPPDESTLVPRAAPGECWSYRTSWIYELGIRMHLATVIPAGFLACFQFIPLIRRKALAVHQLNGYLVLVLSLVGTAGGIMIAPMTFGGPLETQAIVWVLGIAFVSSLILAMVNIRQLQLEEHRAWMLRAWFYAGCIITARLFIILGVTYVSKPNVGPYYHSTSCTKIGQFYDNSTSLVEKYPGCRDPLAWVSVRANFDGSRDEANMAAASLVFGMALWLAFVVHAAGIEIYLHLTPAEAERLRNVSYIRQQAAGFKNPGSAGLTSDKLGDASQWVPKSKSKDI